MNSMVKNSIMTSSLAFDTDDCERAIEIIKRNFCDPEQMLVIKNLYLKKCLQRIRCESVAKLEIFFIF